MKKNNQLINYLFALIIIFLSFVNLYNIFNTPKVLGIATSGNENVKSKVLYWSEFLKNNPKYIPGYIEMKDFDKVNILDPNFLDE